MHNCYVVENNFLNMKDRIKKIHIALLVTLFAVTGCAVTDLDRTVNFAAYKSFNWGEGEVKVENPVYESGLINKNIRHTVEEEFAKRGIVRDKQNPDFIVSYHTYTEQKERRTRSPFYGHPYYPFGFYPFMYGWGWGPYAYGMPQVERYTEGTLIIDISDAKSDELIWRGTVSGKVDDVGNLQKQIAKGVRAIIKKYPVTPEASPVLPQEAPRV
jgi:hypothetical protein